VTADAAALQPRRAAGLEHEVLRHGPVRSLAEAAQARGVEPADVAAPSATVADISDPDA
jgi:Cys-tRNA(Pro)/Cys-tRNA(Cys) deacylase